MGAVAWGLLPSPRFPSPLIKRDEPISGIPLSFVAPASVRQPPFITRGSFSISYPL